MLTLIQGPAGSGKSQLARDLLAAGQLDLLADVTSIWAAVTGATRGLDGKYPVRLDSDPGLVASLYLQTVIARYAVDHGLNVGVTTSRHGQIDRWKSVADEGGTSFSVQTVDPGRRVVEQRLAEPDGSLSQQCQIAISKWYGSA